MRISVFSRESAETMIADGTFPENAVVISFYDPAPKHVKRAYSRLDYDGVCEDVFYCELDDLDLDVLEERGYTYETYFPNADELAEFILKAYLEDKHLICQCEYGQSRSAGCAAAVMEYFYQKGVRFFADYRYYPNQVVYHKVYDALVRRNPMYVLDALFARDTLLLERKTGINHTYWSRTGFRTGAVVRAYKTLLEDRLTEMGWCFHTFEEAYDQLRNGKRRVYVSLHIDNAVPCQKQEDKAFRVESAQQYKRKEIPLTIHLCHLLQYAKNPDYGFFEEETHIEPSEIFGNGTAAFDVFGIMQMDGKKPFMRMVIVTDIVAGNVSGT